MPRLARRLLVLALAIALVLASLYGLWRLHRSRTVQLFGEIVPRVETTDRVVALTFDDGPTPGYTDEVLAMLAERDVKATFYVVGREMDAYPEEARKLVAAGHELGNHSYTHRPMVLMPPSVVQSEIERTDSAIRRVGFEGPIHFRPPYCKKLVVLPWVLSRMDKATITIDVEPESVPGLSASAEGLAEHVLREVRPGSIVLLHVMFESRETSLRAVPSIVDGLLADGYEFVTVSELLARRPG